MCLDHEVERTVDGVELVSDADVWCVYLGQLFSGKFIKARADRQREYRKQMSDQGIHACSLGLILDVEKDGKIATMKVPRHCIFSSRELADAELERLMK